MNKAQFLQTLRNEQTDWEQFLHSIPGTQREQAGIYGHWSVKDAVGHVAAWERYMTARLRAHLRNEPATTQELWGDFIPPADLSDDALNDWMAAQLSNHSFDTILTMQQAVRAQLIDTVQAASEALLTTIGLRIKGLPYHQDDPFWQIIASMSYIHAQDHLTGLRQALAQVA